MTTTYSDLFHTASSTNIAGFEWAERTADFTAEANKAYYCDTALGDVLMTLPPSPSPGDEVAFLIIGANKLNFITTDNVKGAALATDYVKQASEQYLLVILSYVDGTTGWSWDARYDSYIYNSSLGGLSFDYISDKDTNGLFYYLGTNENTTAFANPSPSRVAVTQSSFYSATMTGSYTLDRNDTTFWQSDGGGTQWIRYELIGESFLVNKINIKARDATHTLSTYFNPLHLQYSNNGTDWVTLDTFTPSTTLWNTLEVTSPVFATYYRLLSDGAANYKIVGDVEFYGTLAV